jgi:hypothetical protein
VELSQYQQLKRSNKNEEKIVKRPKSQKARKFKTEGFLGMTEKP